MGNEVDHYELRGYSLNAFSLWAHPCEPVTIWPEAQSHLFADFLLRNLGIKGEVLSAPDGNSDRLDFFLTILSERVTDAFRAGIPVAVKDVWPNATWGIVTNWNSDKRELTGYTHESDTAKTNPCWPSKAIIISGINSRSQMDIKAMRYILKQITALAENDLSRDGWISGVDAYLLWKDRIIDGFSIDENVHRDFAFFLSQARHDAASFFTHHADIKVTGAERMMLACARHFSSASRELEQASQVDGKRDFINLITRAMGNEEKALILLEDLLIRLD